MTMMAKVSRMTMKTVNSVDGGDDGGDDNGVDNDNEAI